MPRPDRRKYALASFCVEIRDEGWYFGGAFDPPSAYRGPYASVASVSLMIARQLAKELERRHRAANGVNVNGHPTPQPF